MSETLLPCPLCGHEPCRVCPGKHETFAVLCVACGLLSGHRQDRDDAIAGWNRRAVIPPPLARDGGERGEAKKWCPRCDTLIGEDGICPECGWPTTPGPFDDDEYASPAAAAPVDWLKDEREGVFKPAAPPSAERADVVLANRPVDAGPLARLQIAELHRLLAPVLDAAGFSPAHETAAKAIARVLAQWRSGLEPGVPPAPIAERGEPRDVPWCCYLPCGKPATHQITDGASPDDFTHSCTEHVGRLLRHGRDATVHQIGSVQTTTVSAPEPTDEELDTAMYGTPYVDMHQKCNALRALFRVPRAAIRLPKENDTSAFPRSADMAHNVRNAALRECAAAIRAAGGKVEGDA